MNEEGKIQVNSKSKQAKQSWQTIFLVKHGSKIENKTPQATTSAAEIVVKLVSASWQAACIFSSHYVLVSNYCVMSW